MRPLLLVFLCLLVSACSAPAKRDTLHDIDVGAKNTFRSGTYLKPRNEDEIRAAYAEYLRHASRQDVSRRDALQRLAQLEFELTDKRAKNQGAHTASATAIEDEIYSATLDRSIELLEISLRDYPDAGDNDKTLYQLAKSYDQKGDHDKSITSLQKLVSKHQKSVYYIESQFRLAEEAFSKRNYSVAEDIYTDILVSKDSHRLQQNARYKRGWARFKQEYYVEAIDDFVELVNQGGLSDYSVLNESQKNQFDEYFNSIGLSFSYLGGGEALNEYFRDHPEFNQIFYAYSAVNRIYLKQQRYSEAAKVLEQFVRSHPASPHLPEAELMIINTWRDSGLADKVIASLDGFYQGYNPQSSYWAANKLNEQIYSSVSTSLKDYIVLAASHLHKDYGINRKEVSFRNAKLWYERYLKHYRAFSQKDNMNLLYAELLAQHNDNAESLLHYELAAYDENIILNKDAAYSTILLASQLHRDAADTGSRRSYLKKLVKYSTLYAQLYSSDKYSTQVVTHASQEAYREEMYDAAIQLTELFADLPFTDETYSIHLIKAHSYFRQKRFQDAEAVYQSLIAQFPQDEKSRSERTNDLAIAIYSQGATALEQQNEREAIRHYARIVDVAATSDIAATGLYDAIAICIENKMWSESIHYVEKFRANYPAHQLSHDVSKKLSIAYLNSKQDTAAATELVKIARAEKDTEYRIAALWKAGELYESTQEHALAISSFEEYAKTWQRPYPQYVESMQKLTDLYTRVQDIEQANHWRQSILDADKRTPGDIKTDRTRFIASQAALSLGRSKHESFVSVRLTVPLKSSLEHKRRFMEDAINLYSRALSYGLTETATEAVHGIGEIYRTFSKALLESDRPENLSGEELEQYNILLEDQSLPFEEKAIEFYEANLAYAKDGIYDDWMQQSYVRLKELFPARYGRDVIVEPYINVLH